MEKNANTNVPPETSSDQRHGGERSPTGPTSSPPTHNRDNNPNPTTEHSSYSDRLPVPPAAETSRRDALLDVGTSYENVVGSSEGEPGKKRGRGDGEEEEEQQQQPPQQQQVKAAKKKGELTEVPKGEPRCATCNKVFKSWKALFGHLRSHPERTYRGALPPPTAAELDIRRCQQQLASTLLTVAQEVAASRRGLDIDLNQPSTADDGHSPEKTGGVGFDLNADPPPESDDED
ncbi:Zinc finger protein ZAT3, partial [Cucurbita argyrosperma subsp. argyrosperma]